MSSAKTYIPSRGLSFLATDTNWQGLTRRGGSTVIPLLVRYSCTKEINELVHCHSGAARFKIPKEEGI
jgi:hypothetical protein